MTTHIPNSTSSRSRPQAPPLDLSWLNLDDHYDVHAEVSRRGLTLDSLNEAAFPPDATEAGNHTMRIRGAAPREGAPRYGYSYIGKADSWSEAVPMLYEEAVQRQWSSATDIPWETLQPLPDDLERAMSQFCTFLNEVEFIAADGPGQWLPRLSPEYYEVGLFLMTQIMDEARHMDVFRKRALANGGGLLAQGPGEGLRQILEAKDFTEMSAILHVQGEGFVQSLFRMGELIGQNTAEKTIFRLCAQDESRHLAFGVMHLKHILESSPERREEIHGYFDRAERVSGLTGTQTPQMVEALTVLLGGGSSPAQLDDGWRLQQLILRKQVTEYYHRLKVAGLGDRIDRMPEAMQKIVKGN
ncbi:MAG: hypothetical protein DK306_000533 [Chloroflexi bacterium]|nr:MAG: hypothetical protein DK306_000533 [Chloroflexota bacterium]